jgi:UDP-2,4-diacetamido-2,4,6-trideoxy-beta-L-altropyranose hydrolase
MNPTLEIPISSAAMPSRRGMLRVLCWVAGGPRVGMGHVLRSLELARTLESAGLGIAGFVCNDDACSQLAITLAGRSVWKENDTELPLDEVDLLLVDRPSGPDERIMQARAAHPRLRIAALDCFDMEGSRADLLVNLINHHPTLVRPQASQVRYHEGAEYAIIRREFLAARIPARGIPSRVREVLVTFGGADPGNHTGLVLEALAQEPLKDTTVRIVVGPNFSRAGEVIARARALGLETLEKIDRLAPWFARADVAVSGGGTTMLELACTGTPTLVLPQNEAEARFASSLAGLGAVRLGRPTVGATTVRRDLDALLNDQPARQRLSRCALEAVDGLGQQRIARLLLALFTPATS